MKPLWWPAVRAAVLAALLFSSGCLASDVLVTVNPDGSGTITHTVKRFNSAWAALNGPRQHSHVGELPPPPAEEISETAVREHAKRFGKGVRLVSTTRLTAEDTEGRTSTYAFERVQDLAIDLFPHMPGADFSFSLPWMPAPTDTAPSSTNLTFDFEAHEDGTRLLTARFPDLRFDAAATPPLPAPPQSAAPATPAAPDETALVLAIVRNARMDIRVRTATPLVRTNSPHREENKVVLLAIDVERLISSNQIASLAIHPASLDEIRWALHDLEGATIALDRDVTIEFSGPPVQVQPPPPPAAQAPPDTEIFLASLAVDGDTVKLGTPVNISNSPGYDNQPSFTPDGRAILFTSARGRASGATDAQPLSATDIYRFDLATASVRQLTATPEGEYSPTVMPDGRHISAIRVEADGTQRLWQFTVDGQEPALVLPEVKPVGYHAWVDEQRLALFVLGEPATLRLADRGSGKTDVIARDIGRSLQRIPKGGISYVQVERAPGERAARALTIMELDARTRATRKLVQAVAGAAEADLAWTPDGLLLMAHRDTLYAWRRGRESWTAAADLGALGLRGVSRLAVSPAGDRVAIVAQPRQP